MRMKGKGLLYTAIAIVILVLSMMYLKFELPVISVSAEKLPHMSLLGMPITNSLLTAWLVTIILIVGAYLITRDMKMVPSGMQNVLELFFEYLFGVIEGMAPPQWAKRFVLIPMTIFFYVLISNWFGLLPGLAGIGFCEEPPHAETSAEMAHPSIVGCAEGEVIVPLFRSPSSDLNNTLVLALVTQIAAQVFGFWALGFGGYMGKFFIFDGILKAFKPDEHGNKRNAKAMFGQLAMGTIEMLVGLLEFLSEFTKIIAYTFRLFGNIFAGEVMIIVLTFLVPTFIALPSLGLEVFVGLVQAFVFFILSVAFYTLAITPHHQEDGAH